MARQGGIWSEADLVAGPLYDYLGHFRQRQWLMQGHNDIDENGKIDNADDQNNYVAATESGVDPGASSSAVGEFAAESAAGNAL